MTDAANEQEVLMPDIGDIPEVNVIEVLVGPDDKVRVDDSLITVESDKATMEVPSLYAGTVKHLKVSVGDYVREGSAILTLVAAEPDESVETQPLAPPVEVDANQGTVAGSPEKPANETVHNEIPSKPELPFATEPQLPVKLRRKLHASPSVRRFARELGADLAKIKGMGRKGRILRDDVQAFIKNAMERAEKSLVSGIELTEPPQIDFSQFGDIETQPLSRIKQLSGVNLHRSWVTIPHVTQHDEADITDLEAFRQSLKGEAEQQNLKITLLPFLVKAAVAALKAFPVINASLAANGEELVLKKYFHIGIAVDTPDGLVAPVMRDADEKGILDLAAELRDISERARSKKLSPRDFQGGSFTISSLGGIAGTAFTPIVNTPEVAILGVSRAKTQPVYQQGEFVPRLLLPLSLSYDHRVIDGAEAARFTGYLTSILADLRRLLL